MSDVSGFLISKGSFGALRFSISWSPAYQDISPECSDEDIVTCTASSLISAPVPILGWLGFSGSIYWSSNLMNLK